MNMIKNFLALMVLMVAAMQAQTPVTIVERGGTKIVLGAIGATYNSGMTAIVTTGTAITTSNIKFKVIWCRNDSAGALNITVADAAGEVYVPTQSMAAKSVLFVAGTDMGVSVAGLTITASANSAIKCQVEGARQ